mgnify:CR=1 FL=1
MAFEFNKQRVKEAKQATGLTGREIRRIAQELGIKNFNSKNEQKRVIKAARENQVTSAFQDELGRDPEQYELRNYTNELAFGNSDIGDIRYRLLKQSTVEDDVQDATLGTDEQDTVPGADVTDTLPGADVTDTLPGAGGTDTPDYSDLFDSYENRLDGLEDDYEDQLNRFKGEMEDSINRYKGLYDAEVLGRDQDRTRMQTEFDEKYAAQEKDFLDQLNARNRAEAADQLAGLRAGTTASSTARPTGAASLTSGQTTASREQKGSVFDIRPEVNATDSVLNRKGPVVQLINKLQARRPSGGGGGQSPLSGGGASNYYASRFG